MKPGRREHTVWRCYGPIVVAAKRKIGQRACKGCGTNVTNVVSRAITHAEQCKQLHAAGFWKKPRTITQDLQACTTVAQQGAHVAIGRAVFALNLPLSSLDHPAWRQMLKALNPSLRPPTGKTIGNAVLDELFAKDRADWAVELKAEMVSLSCDGWTGPLGQPVIGICVADQLFHSEETRGEPHTGQFVADYIAKAIIDVKGELGCTIASVVTDSASNMQSARNLLKTKNPEVFSKKIPHVTIHLHIVRSSHTIASATSSISFAEM